MKRIYFDDIANNRCLSVLLVIAIACFLAYIFAMTFEVESSWIHLVGALGNLLMVVFFGRPFFFKHYVQWNKVGVTIRINSFWGKNISFKNIRQFDLLEDQLEITKKSGQRVVIDLRGIEPADGEELARIIREHTGGMASIAN